MVTNCASLLADLFLYACVKEGKRKLARKFNLSYCYTDDLISFSNKRFKEFISDIYAKELTISDTTESTSVASYLDLLFTRDENNNITIKLYDKRDEFDFHIVNFPFMSSNIPSAPAYGVYASQLIRYAHCCSNNSDFLSHHRALVTRPLSQVYKIVCPTHLRNSMADTLIQLDNTRKMFVKCLLIVPIKMIFIYLLIIFPRFVKAELIKLAKMAGVMHKPDHTYSVRSTW